MKKNVSGQVVVAQLNSKTDGSAVTAGSTTVWVLGDGGTQSSGSGTVTHEGNGCWSYIPTQAETNYDHVAFTFVNSSAVIATIQVWTGVPQTGDSFARLGAPANASVSADIAAVNTKTANLPTDPADASDISAAFSTVNSTLTTIAGYIDTEVAAIKAKTDNLPASPAAVADIPSAATVAGAVWDVVLASHLTSGSTGAALNAAGSSGDPWATALPGAYGSGTAGHIVGNRLDAAVSSRQATLDGTARDAIADALLKRDFSSISGEANRSAINALRFLRNKWSVSGTTLTVTKEDDSTSAWSATITASPGADPISAVDPA